MPRSMPWAAMVVNFELLPMLQSGGERGTMPGFRNLQPAGPFSGAYALSNHLHAAVQRLFIYILGIMFSNAVNCLFEYE